MRQRAGLDKALVHLSLLSRNLSRVVVQAVAVILGNHIQISGYDHGTRCVKGKHTIRGERSWRTDYRLGGQVLLLILVFKDVAILLLRLLILTQPGEFHGLQ